MTVECNLQTAAVETHLPRQPLRRCPADPHVTEVGSLSANRAAGLLLCLKAFASEPCQPAQRDGNMPGVHDALMLAS